MIYVVQRIARDQRSVQSWLDYGAFCLLYEDATKAQECFQQAVCLDPQQIQRWVGGEGVEWISHTTAGAARLTALPLP